MVPLTTFSLGEPVERESHAGLMELLFEGSSTGRLVQGKILEQQFQVDSRYLLMTTEDIPYEESLHIYLLDAGFALLDEQELGVAYAPGLLRDIVVVSSEQLQFSFFGTERWTLTVLVQPRRRWWFPRGQRRPRVQRLFAKHYLVLEHEEEFT